MMFSLLILGSFATSQLADVSGPLRQILLDNMPKVLHEQEHNWGQQRPAKRLTVDAGLRFVKVMRNDGNWWKVRAETGNLAKDLNFQLSEAKKIDQDRLGFHISIVLPMVVHYENQVWESGLRLYSGSARARMRVLIDLDVECTLKTETKGGIIPDLVFRMKVIQSNVRYDNLVVEHIAGVGGSAARLIGEGIRSSMKQWFPSIERKALEKASAAIVKAGDTKEIRIGLSKLRTP